MIACSYRSRAMSISTLVVPRVKTTSSKCSRSCASGLGSSAQDLVTALPEHGVSIAHDEARDRCTDHDTDDHPECDVHATTVALGCAVSCLDGRTSPAH